MVKPTDREREVVEVNDAEEKAVEAPAPSGDSSGAPEAESMADPVAALQQDLETARAQAAEYLDQWRRTAAEFSNFKKRLEKEQAEQSRLAAANIIRKLLPVLDDFERAFQTLPPNLMGLTWIDGIALIHRKLQFILEQEGVKPIETQGKTFDPLYHEAVTHEAVEGMSEGQIIGEVQKGYMLGDRVLRPALVRVAK
jgi:molecular chaperone GrpE